MSKKTKSEPMQRQEPILSVDSLSVDYRSDRGRVKALRSVSLSILPGDTFGLVGESGSGKSTLALAIMRYLGENGSITGGEIKYNGQSLTKMSRKELQSIRGKHISHVAQNPDEALNPSIRVGEQILETIRLHQDLPEEESRQRMLQLLRDVGISDPEYNATQYPHQLSGGMKQRVLLAIGLSCNPNLLILDEPTSGLDVTTQEKILKLIEELKSKYDTAILIITHNLGVIARIADNVGIIYAGEMMEHGRLEDVFNAPANPYTQGLLGSLPEIGASGELASIPGNIPTVYEEPEGCIFADRCKLATDKCHESPVEYATVSDEHDHKTRCHRWETAIKKPINENNSNDSIKNESDIDDINKEQPGINIIMEVSKLKKYYDEQGILDSILGGNPPVRAVDGVNLTINEGETVGLVGESGCGKSTFGRVLAHLTEPTEGEVKFRGSKLSGLSSREINQFRSECQIVFQNPDGSLNPRKTVFESISRPLKLFTDLEGEQLESRVKDILQEVGLNSEYATRFPHELSGGEKQRIGIGRAFAPNPSLIILDEPVSALDVSVQADILNLLSKLKKKYGTSYLAISHDLSVVNHICDRVAVMYLGKIVEVGKRKDVFNPPHHPYTRALLSNSPSPDPNKSANPILLEGEVPSPRDPPTGCSFHNRCPEKIGEVCESEIPVLEPTKAGSTGHCISCHLEESEMNKNSDKLASVPEKSDNK